MAQAGTLFGSDSMSGGAVGTISYVQDSFEDTVLPPSNNTGLTSNASTNPFGVFIADAEAVQYGVKTLWIKEIKLLQDRSKWINTQPTYEVIFHENYPGVFCYAALRNAPTATDQFYEPWRLEDPNTKPFYLGSTDDWTFGVTGRFSRVAFLVGKDGMSGRLFVDGVDTSAFAYANVTTQASSNPYSMFYSPAIHATSDLTDDIHDVRIAPTAATPSNPSVFGIQIYFNNAGSNVQVGPGSSYNNKNKLVSATGSTFAVPSFGSSMGGIAQYAKDATGNYATFLTSLSTISTIVQGSNGSTLLTASAGTGASFPSGTGFVVDQGGGSFYVGSVVSVSTDTLTVNPALPFGVSGTLSRRWVAGPTLAFSGMTLVYSWNPEIAFGMTTTFPSAGDSTPTVFYEPMNNIEINGSLGFTSIGDGQALVTLNSSTDILRCCGDFSAAEVEWSGLGLTSLITVNVNDCFGFTSSLQVGDGFNSAGSTIWISRMSMFGNAGVGVNNFDLSFDPTTTNAAIKRINFYKYTAVGATLDILGTLEHNQAYASRPDGSSAMALGLDRRVPPQCFGYTGTWTFGFVSQPHLYQATVSGTNAGSFEYQWFGKDFSLLGRVGSSAVLLLDGVSIPAVFNQHISVASEGWHRIQYLHKAGTGGSGSSKISGIDYQRTFREVDQVQNSNVLPTRKIAIPIVKDFGNRELSIVGATTNPVKGTYTETGHLRREGKYLVIDYMLSNNVAGNAGAGVYSIPMPFGLIADAKYLNPTFQSVGPAIINGNGVLAGNVIVEPNNTLRLLGLTDSSAIGQWGEGVGTVGNLGADGIFISFNARIPIVGWDDYEYIEVNDG